MRHRYTRPRGSQEQLADRCLTGFAAWPATALFATVLALGALVQDARSDDRNEMPFAEANVFVELNDTDGDLGVHALIDGEAWKLLEIEAPNERVVLKVTGMGRLRQQGLTEIFFESAEPSFDELSPEEFFERFPEGNYEIEGITLEGAELESTAEFTHVLPAPPDNILVSGVAAAESCDADPLPSVSRPVTIAWDAVTESHPDIGRLEPDIEIVGYQVVVEREEPTLLIFSIDLPPDVTSITVPDDFVALGTELKFEVLVREASGNQTAVESCFEVEAEE
jgi:hypothetical protein